MCICICVYIYIYIRNIVCVDTHSVDKPCFPKGARGESSEQGVPGEGRGARGFHGYGFHIYTNHLYSIMV